MIQIYKRYLSHYRRKELLRETLLANSMKVEIKKLSKIIEVDIHKVKNLRVRLKLQIRKIKKMLD